MMYSPLITKTAAILGCCTLALAARGDGPIMIAGWDFSQFLGDGITSVDGAAYATSLPANYSDLDPNGLGAESAAFGRLYYDGQFGSTNGNPESEVLPYTGDLANNPDPGSFGYPFNAGGSYTLLQAEGQQFTNPLSLTVGAAFGGGTGSLVFGATPGGECSGWELAFSAATTQDGAVQVDAAFSKDGQTYSSVGSATIAFTDGLFVFTVPANASASGYFRLTFSGLTQSVNPVLDNVSIRAKPGGSPGGTFWAASPVSESGWRDTAQGYPGEYGVGWIHDAAWPFIHALGLGGSGSWAYIVPDTGDRNGFYAWVFDGGYWIHGVSLAAHYYSWEPGAEGWHAFSL